ncbi:MAG: DUF502 domain-containing protein [Longimicrobiales bacterium]
MATEHRVRFSARIRRHLIAGLVVIAPVTATVWVLWWIFRLLDGLLGRFLSPMIQRWLPWDITIPGLGLIALFLILVVTGWAAERAVGSRVLAAWHRILERIPVTSRIYTAANRIVRAIFAGEKRAFSAVVLIEFPSEGRWSIGFLSADAPGFAREFIPDAISVFVPTTPNPTTGFLVMVPREKALPVTITMDEAFTLILSGGAVSPESMAARAALKEAVPAGA